MACKVYNGTFHQQRCAKVDLYRITGIERNGVAAKDHSEQIYSAVANSNPIILPLVHLAKIVRNYLVEKSILDFFSRKYDVLRT